MGGLTHHHFDILHFLYLGLLAIAVAMVWMRQRDKTPDWPQTEGTIQSVNEAFVQGQRKSGPVDVADFSYRVNDEYYAGRLKISRLPSAGDRSTKVLIHQKIQVSYDPRKPAEFSVPGLEVAGFQLYQYIESPFDSDVNPIDLNIDKS